MNLTLFYGLKTQHVTARAEIFLFWTFYYRLRKISPKLIFPRKKSYDFKVRRNLQNLQKHPSSFTLSSVVPSRPSASGYRSWGHGGFGLGALEKRVIRRLTWLNCIRFGSDMRLRDDTFHYENEYHQRTIDWSNYNVRSNTRRSLTYDHWRYKSPLAMRRFK